MSPAAPLHHEGSSRPLRRLDPGALTSEQRTLYDEITGGPRGVGPQHFRLVDEHGGLVGPFNAFLLQPAVGSRLQALGSAIRYETTLSDRAREIAILVVAASWRSEFEQYAHEAIGRAIGLTDDELAAVRSGPAADTQANWPDSDDHLIVRSTRALVEDGDLDDELYAQLIAAVGEPGLFELTTLVGYYATLALQLRVFRVAAPDDTSQHTFQHTSDQLSNQGTTT